MFCFIQGIEWYQDVELENLRGCQSIKFCLKNFWINDIWFIPLNVQQEEVHTDKSELNELTLTFIIIITNLGCHWWFCIVILLLIPSKLKACYYQKSQATANKLCYPTHRNKVASYHVILHHFEKKLCMTNIWKVFLLLV